MEAVLSVRPLIDLDQDQNQTTIVVEFHGLKVRLDRDRVLGLLQTEQEHLVALSGGTLATPRSDGRKHAPPSRAAPEQNDVKLSAIVKRLGVEEISHAKLSTRIKKIYDYSAPSRQIRPAHMGLLGEMIASFDWVLPDHPNTHLDQHLDEMLQWDGPTSEFRLQVQSFLKAYRQKRAAAAAG